MDARSFWNERFSGSGYAYGTDPNDFLKRSVGHFHGGGRVLCLAEGEGRNALFLARRGYEVCAIDLSDTARDKAMKLAAEHGVTFEYVVTDVNDYDFGIDAWDAIVSISAHTDPATRQRVFRKTLKGLKPGGVFLLEAYHPNQLNYDTGGPRDIAWLVALDDLHHHFSERGIIHQAELERDVSEGAYHTGKAFVTQFIFRKAPS